MVDPATQNLFWGGIGLAVVVVIMLILVAYGWVRGREGMTTILPRNEIYPGMTDACGSMRNSPYHWRYGAFRWA